MAREVEFPPLPAVTTEVPEGEEPEPGDVEAVRAHVLACIQAGLGAAGNDKQQEQKAEALLASMLDHMSAKGPEAALAATREAQALGKLATAVVAYLEEPPLGDDPMECRTLAKELSVRLRKELKRRDALSPLDLAFEGIWKVQRGGRRPRGSYAVALGATLWLDPLRMALVETLLVRDKERQPRYTISGPDWFEDSEKAVGRWERVYRERLPRDVSRVK